MPEPPCLRSCYLPPTGLVRKTHRPWGSQCVSRFSCAGLRYAAVVETEPPLPQNSQQTPNPAHLHPVPPILTSPLPPFCAPLSQSYCSTFPSSTSILSQSYHTSFRRFSSFTTLAARFHTALFYTHATSFPRFDRGSRPGSFTNTHQPITPPFSRMPPKGLKPAVRRVTRQVHVTGPAAMF